MALKVYENLDFIGNHKVTGNELYKHKLTNEVFELVPTMTRVSDNDEWVKTLLEGWENKGGMIKS